VASRKDEDVICGALSSTHLLTSRQMIEVSALLVLSNLMLVAIQYLYPS